MAPGAPTAGRPYLDLFLVSFLLLFFELACIRWFGSTVVFLTFFTNIILLATFLGMSVGCLAASDRRDWARLVLPLLLFVTLLSAGLLWARRRLGRVLVDVGSQGSPEQVYFGTEFVARDVGSFVVPIEVLAALFFLLIALMFAGVGQVMGRAFTRAPDRLLAYICNIAGSLAGIAAFAAASHLRTAPLVWFAVVGGLWMHFLVRTTWQSACLVATLLAFSIFGSQVTVRAPFQHSNEYGMLLWSPYYKIHYIPAQAMIVTNNINHQQIVPVGSAPAYLLPHLLNRDAGRPPFRSVLIIGAGSGNDVATALEQGATHVDAVEIDPALFEIGRANHPNHPYQDPRVTVHIEDGRNFLRRTDRQYDLIVYALVDSLVLHSGYSSLRLESFLFTQQAFDDIAARLAPGGVFAGYNFYRQGWIVGRIHRLADQAFGTAPLVMSLPYVGRIGVDDPQASRMTFILASRDDGLSAIRRLFEANESFWINAKPALNAAVNGFSARPPDGQDSPAGSWLRIAPADVEVDASDRAPTDDWPFLYLRDRVIPALNLRNMALLAVLSLGFLYLMSPARPVRLNWQMFLLGAGFMLLETKSVVHMALLFGSTWIVNSVVFFAILVMILTSNLYVLLVRPRRLWPYYALLVAAFAVNVLVPMGRFLALPGSAKVVASCLVVFVPIFFAGIIFGTLFSRSTQPDVDFGSNIAGAMTGGFAESLALVVGFNYLLIVAVIFYLFSAVSGRPRRIGAAPS